jgi:hypothetical protein
MAGDAVELALKACIAKLVSQYDFPDRELAVKAFTHEIEVLVKTAGLTPVRDQDAKSNQTLAQNRLLVKNWNERACFARWLEAQARELFSAFTDTTDGVLPWIKCRW